MERPNINAVVDDLLRQNAEFSSGELARRLGVSRQTAHMRLAALVRAGRLVRVGGGRGSRYRHAATVRAAGVWSRTGLNEEEVWRQFKDTAAAHANVNAVSILHYALTEMVNNAIDHSSGSTVSARIVEDGATVAFDVEDDGVGIFEHVIGKRGLASPFEAIAELQKGKVTTAPSAHTGEGLFFTSKLADRMTVESGTTRWVIDGRRQDQGVELAPARKGTLVHFEIARTSTRKIESVFSEFTDENLAFTRTRTSIRLFREGAELVSRSEAKRLLAGLEKFKEVELDFKDLTGLGQGFADEVFRVWQRNHPDVKLVVVNANAPVQFMISRAKATGPTARVSRPAEVRGEMGDSTVNVVLGSTNKTST